MNNLQGADEHLVARVVAAVLRELSGGAPAEPEPVLMSDPDVRRRFFGGIARTKYWQISKEPGFPIPVMVGRTKYRRVADLRRWLAEREVS